MIAQFFQLSCIMFGIALIHLAAVGLDKIKFLILHHTIFLSFFVLDRVSWIFTFTLHNTTYQRL